MPPTGSRGSWPTGWRVERALGMDRDAPRPMHPRCSRVFRPGLSGQLDRPTAVCFSVFLLAVAGLVEAGLTEASYRRWHSGIGNTQRKSALISRLLADPDRLRGPR